MVPILWRAGGLAGLYGTVACTSHTMHARLHARTARIPADSQPVFHAVRHADSCMHGYVQRESLQILSRCVMPCVKQP